MISGKNIPKQPLQQLAPFLETSSLSQTSQSQSDCNFRLMERGIISSVIQLAQSWIGRDMIKIGIGVFFLRKSSYSKTKKGN